MVLFYAFKNTYAIHSSVPLFLLFLALSFSRAQAVCFHRALTGYTLFLFGRGQTRFSWHVFATSVLVLTVADDCCPGPHHQINELTYSALLGACGRAKKLARAFRVVEDMRETGLCRGAPRPDMVRYCVRL